MKKSFWSGKEALACRIMIIFFMTAYSRVQKHPLILEKNALQTEKDNVSKTKHLKVSPKKNHNSIFKTIDFHQDIRMNVLKHLKKNCLQKTKQKQQKKTTKINKNKMLSAGSPVDDAQPHLKNKTILNSTQIYLTNTASQSAIAQCIPRFVTAR